MKERETTPGKTYSVHTMKGCTIIEPDGWSKTIEAPDGYFDAHFGSVVIEGDDEASIKQLFKLAPQQRLALLGVLGGGDPAWLAPLKAELTALLDGSKFELAWLDSKNTLVVHTDRVSDELLAAVKATAEAAVPAGVEIVQYNHNIEISWRDVTVHVPPTEVNKYDHCTTVNEIEALNPDYKNDLTSDGGWGYALFNLKYGSKNNGIGWDASGLLMQSSLRKFGLRILPKLETAVKFLASSKLEELELELPMATNIGAAWKGNQVGICSKCDELRRAELTIPKASIIRESFFQCPKLESLTLKGTNATDLYNLCYNNKSLSSFWINSQTITVADSAFHLCILTKESALHILHKLATYTDGAEHLITIGIHVDHKYDPDVNLALKKADINYEPTVELPEEVTEGKGWTVTVQWNGTPTSTASTMAMGQLIYAKVGEMERPDGTTEQFLDWGHYVTDWEARGYEQFRSLASACRYFGLPEEDLTNN